MVATTPTNKKANSDGRHQGADLKNIELQLPDDGVRFATLNRAAKRNALNAETIEELVTLFSSIPQSKASAVVLNAAGDHFCAGLDLGEHVAFCGLQSSSMSP